ncbi:DUF3179 domain-containing protein [Roseobacter sp. HKCCD9010]|uniref:DUF3179 domain-containing protein n=1 Tax=unclassified Roseobacter TaxID=196798 RepID=UPI0014918AE0|nr:MULTISPECIES: DUF3179 domain-containing protein [unclassified Roseobacter]MBF9050212.1 DUF3179 domain-containing protein [Rhodobacterales bacterium HKCCD4356]NNV12455.1 DUF3179 domain-containing protein [Roseobacter sp. HKCCD7357]NNV16080.1 DUF3179 domain-containing protein [Roseobacter sp. HKCCD8768]NNV25540.1 DUF3179 domain-containing protein [Roseobacter sp. HKCCD8192]NNV29797.1 DUF3179 domain-containing protein [Roseobacter sp. HKCCD9061]
MLTRRHFSALSASAALTPITALAQTSDEFDTLFRAQYDLIYGSPSDFIAALEFIHTRGNPDMAAGLITALRFTPISPDAIDAALQHVTGEPDRRGWFDWMLWQEANPQVIPHPSFVEVKRTLFLQIDPNFSAFLRPEYLERDRMRIRFEEITWGGVRKDGIPSLDNPDLITAAEAEYMRPDDLVFGVSINGDARAYPLRIMGWHEMFNEVIGGVPVALAYCTLCGAGILFETEVEARAEPFIFGSSGFLYRSNKLMFDRATHSLWNQFTGEPVVGPLVDSGIRLRERPVVIDTWEAWRAANPETQILSLNTGFSRNYGSGVVYRDYFASDDLMFPTLVDQSEHLQKDYVFGIRQFGGAKAWPLDAFADQMVLNDGMLDTSLVLIGEADRRSVRAYERGDLTFSGDTETLTSNDGMTWRVTEDALEADDGRSLPRVAGHIAYWFAWNGYLGAESELYARD